jgi:hypothetical protein
MLVSSTYRVVRLERRVPMMDSSFSMRRLRAGGDRCMCSAAAQKLPALGDCDEYLQLLQIEINVFHASMILKIAIQ